MGKNINKILGENVKALREQAELTQEKLAEMAGMSVTGLQRLESAERWPRPENLAGVARALGLEPWQLLLPSLTIDSPVGLGNSALHPIGSEANQVIDEADSNIRQAANDDANRHPQEHRLKEKSATYKSDRVGHHEQRQIEFESFHKALSECRAEIISAIRQELNSHLKTHAAFERLKHSNPDGAEIVAGILKLEPEADQGHEQTEKERRPSRSSAK
jgi:transcriptional regulator with XRE-family HTH domain